MTNEQPTHLDLFSGIGGFALAAQWAGFRTVAFCEIDPYCQAILKARFGAVMADSNGTRKSPGREDRRVGWKQELPAIHANIRTLDGRRYAGVNIITGGFPCQPFSFAGKRRGKDDDRYLWPEMLRVVSEARPDWVLGENVAGIIQMELDLVLSDLENIGYAVWPLVIPACAVDARHRRDRVWIVGHAAGTSTNGHSRRTGSTYSLFGNSSEVLAHPECLRSFSRRSYPGEQEISKPIDSCENGAGWLPEPDVGRVAHGIPSRVDRLKGLGNAIVPPIAYEILKVIRALSQPSMAGLALRGTAVTTLKTMRAARRRGTAPL